jgi:hypothetical protein
MNICSISQCFYVFYAEKDICVRTTECANTEARKHRSEELALIRRPERMIFYNLQLYTYNYIRVYKYITE